MLKVEKEDFLPKQKNAKVVFQENDVKLLKQEDDLEQMTQLKPKLSHRSDYSSGSEILEDDHIKTFDTKPLVTMEEDDVEEGFFDYNYDVDNDVASSPKLEPKLIVSQDDDRLPKGWSKNLNFLLMTNF